MPALHLGRNFADSVGVFGGGFEGERAGDGAHLHFMRCGAVGHPEVIQV